MSLHLKLGKLDIEAGSAYHKVGRLWIPDGLHVWFGAHGLHAYWGKSKYQPRITTETVDG